MSEEIQKIKKSKIVNIILPIIAVIILVLTLGQSLFLAHRTEVSISEDSQNQYQNLTKAYASILEERLDRFAENLDRYVHAGVVESKNTEVIVNWLRQNPEMRGVFDYVAFVDKDANFWADNGSQASIPDRDYFLPS